MHKFIEGAILGLLLAIVFASIDTWARKFDDTKRSIINIFALLLLLLIAGCGFILFNF